MTREEEIKNEAKLHCHDIASEVDCKSSAAYDGFVMGAKWADENPDKNLVYTKQELMNMGFGFDLNGNISTPQEIEERLKRYINYRKNKWIEKVCEWMREQVYQEYGGGPLERLVPDERIEDFRKAMEE